MSKLLSVLNIANLELKNRVVMPPMCMYEVRTEDGRVQAFHHAHYGQRAIGQPALIIIEATAVEADGRLSNRDLGLWEDVQLEGFKNLVYELKGYGVKIGVQLSHGGRKSRDAICPIAPSAVGFSDEYKLPKEMSMEDIKRVQKSFIEAAERAAEAGVDMIELHGAHGYLINQFLEKATNLRKDAYGGSLENRYRFVGEILSELRQLYKGSLWIRLSMSAYNKGNQNTIEEYQIIGSWLERDGVDCIDVSTGGLLNCPPDIEIYPGYQSYYTQKMKEAVKIPVSAVGLISSPELAEYILQNNHADLIEVGRELIANPNWISLAASKLGDKTWEAYNNSYKRALVRQS